MSESGVIRTRWLGRVEYVEALDLQRAMWEGITTGRTSDDYLLLLEHPHTYTVGRGGDGSNLLVGEDLLDELGVALFDVDRGGDITYHGPGQLIGYPIVAIQHTGGSLDTLGHLRRIENVLIATLADLGVEAWAEKGYTGVWTERGKIAAIGVRVSKGVSTHGFSINVDPDMSYYSNIVPCGITEREVTSLNEILGEPISIQQVVEALLNHVMELTSHSEIETQIGAFTRGSSTRSYEIDKLVEDGVFGTSLTSENLPLLAAGTEVTEKAEKTENGSSYKGVQVSTRGLLQGEPEKPQWMKVRVDLGDVKYMELRKLNRGLELNTVCEEAGCPNIAECWTSGTSTLMLLGDTCTRSCSFCDIKTGRPGEVDEGEPVRAAEAIAEMGLEHAVLTSVNRDDLDDGGARIFARTINEIRSRLPQCDVEVLIPDFKGECDPLNAVLDANPAVLNHNIETVLGLQREIRTAANYARSLVLLARARWLLPSVVVKSGLIVGMGETDNEVTGALADLNAVGVDVVTIGQYLRPTAVHRKIDRYVHPGVFDEYKVVGENFGIGHVESGPLVRSSYHAREAFSALID